MKPAAVTWYSVRCKRHTASTVCFQIRRQASFNPEAAMEATLLSVDDVRTLCSPGSWTAKPIVTAEIGRRRVGASAQMEFLYSDIGSKFSLPLNIGGRI